MGVKTTSLQSEVHAVLSSNMSLDIIFVSLESPSTSSSHNCLTVAKGTANAGRAVSYMKYFSQTSGTNSVKTIQDFGLMTMNSISLITDFALRFIIRHIFLSFSASVIHL